MTYVIKGKQANFLNIFKRTTEIRVQCEQEQFTVFLQEPGQLEYIHQLIKVANTTINLHSSWYKGLRSTLLLCYSDEENVTITFNMVGIFVGVRQLAKFIQQAPMPSMRPKIQDASECNVESLYNDIRLKSLQPPTLEIGRFLTTISGSKMYPGSNLLEILSVLKKNGYSKLRILEDDDTATIEYEENNMLLSITIISFV